MKDNNGYESNRKPELPEKGEQGKAFGLPENYFSTFEDKLKKRLEAEEELKEYPLLSAIPKRIAYSVPGNYFESLELKTELQAYPQLQAVKKVEPSLGAAYLEESRERILHKIELMEELKDYALLYSLDKVNIFNVPAGYFDELPSVIKERAYVPVKEAVSLIDKVIAVISGHKFSFAFGLVFLCSIGFYLYKANQSTRIITGDCKTMACLEKKELLNQQVLSRFNEDELMEMVDVNKLDQQIKAAIPKEDQKQEEEFLLEQVNTDQLIDEL